MGAVIALCAHMIKALSETFRGGQTYTQAFKVVIYGLSPVFLFRLLDAAPTINLWVPWVMGMMLCVKILYIGVPRVMQPDPPHAFGLFVMSCASARHGDGIGTLPHRRLFGGELQTRSSRSFPMSPPSCRS